ncbi:MAG: GH92 family glycosyl hydrolase [Kofleriaceae bacterium]
MKKAVLAVACVVACGEPSPDEPLPEVTDTVAQVDPRIGTGGLGFAHGSCFVGAAVPHGLVKLGPDTNGPFGTVNFLHYSGYFAEDDRIRGFSHLHLHGAGATDYGVLSVMPVLAFDPAKLTAAANETRFAKADEHASAGRYAVTLANGIAVELTATQRAAVHRYTGAGAVVLDLAKALEGGAVDQAAITVAADELSGQLHHTGGMSGGYGGYTVYFVARARTPWTSHTVWSASSPPAAGDSASGTDVGAALTFDPAAPVELAIGISLVSIEGARANLAAEIPAVDFDAVYAQAIERWRAVLDTVRITGGSEAERRTFYTSLYHAFLMPSVIDDADGTYQLAGQSAATAVGWHQMSDLSLWDTYRTVQPLYGWLVPTSARDSVRSLVAFGEGLGSFPKWPLAIGETGTMLGASAEIAIADAVMRGVPDTGAELAWPALRAAAVDPVAPPGGRGGRGDVVPYLKHGYVPRDLGIGRTVSLTTEYAHDDFALAQLAGELGNPADHDALLARSLGWRTLYDPSTGFLRGKNADNSFPAGAFDPLELGDDYAEANAWHSLWMAGAHDPDGLAEILGGREAAVAKLEEFFASAKLDWDTADESAANFPRPYYWHGNEPDMNAAYLFAQLGRPELTAEWVRWIEDEMYSDQPAGVAGNDDGGTLGAWYVLSTLGVYPIPGSDRWILGVPKFSQARVLAGDTELVISTSGSGTRIVAVELDGAVVDGPTLTHAQLAAATSLRFVVE